MTLRETKKMPVGAVYRLGKSRGPRRVKDHSPILILRGEMAGGDESLGFVASIGAIQEIVVGSCNADIEIQMVVVRDGS